jgi:divalent metal cation (Fe/Co/Zn/Cd) transporter
MVWTVGASCAEVALGLTHHILSLAVFGLAGLLDAAGSATLVSHFRHALNHDGLSDRRERRAVLVVSSGLIVLGLVTIIEGGRRLVDRHAGHTTTAGTTIAAVSIVVLTALAITKKRVGRQTGSEAMVADSALSASGAVLAIVAIVGATFAGDDRWSWVDPTAAIVMAAFAAAYGVAVIRRT